MLRLIRLLRRKRCLTVAPMPLPEAIPVEEAEVAAIFAEFDVIQSTEGNTYEEEEEEEEDEETMLPRRGAASIASHRDHEAEEAGQQQTLVALGEPLSPEPIMARVLVLGRI